MPRDVFDAIRTSRQAGLRAVLARILPEHPRFVFEIGSGNGHFLAAYGAAHPDQLCIGIDRQIERIDRALRKKEHATLANVHFLRCMADDFLLALPAEATFIDVYVLFPDPWPKKRHHKNRLINPAFLDDIAGRAGRETRLFFRTDYQPYFDEVVAVVAAHPRWRALPAGPFPFECMTMFQLRAPRFHSLAARVRDPKGEGGP